jgi:hypothetical protein
MTGREPPGAVLHTVAGVYENLKRFVLPGAGSCTRRVRTGPSAPMIAAESIGWAFPAGAGSVGQRRLGFLFDLGAGAGVRPRNP